MITLKNKFPQLLFIVFTCIFFLSCKKDVNNDNNGYQYPDFTVKVTSSVSGFVTDENNAAVLGANVSAGDMNATTDKFGFFEIKNAQVVKTAAVVTVSKPGYFKGIKTYMAEDTKAAFFRIRLIPKTNAGSINAGAGGSVSLSNGLIVALPANAVVKASDNSAYTGTINVALHWIDPTAADLNQSMPGDLRGIATDGSLKILNSYGMAAVELTGASGELLQIASGKKATLTLNIPSTILSTAPATIPLWSFDEANGLWKQEGAATKTGNTYVGEVSHFSFWNFDIAANYVQFNCTLKDASGNPVPYATVKISVPGTNDARYGWTDASGYVSGQIPANTQLLLEVFNSYYCSTPVYSQNFTTTNVNVSLGVIIIPTGINLATISGTVTDCNNNPVTDGYIIMLDGSQYFRYAISNSGTFSFNAVLCNNTATVTFIAEDNIGHQQSGSLTMTLTSGANSIGNLQACGISNQEFITYSINGGTAIQFSTPADTLVQETWNTGSVYAISGSRHGTNLFVNATFNGSGIAVGSAQNLESFNSSEITQQTTISNPVSVNITEYGTVGEFIAGNFTGTIVTVTAPATTYTIVCSFRLRRHS